MATVPHSMPTGDDWLGVPTSSRPNFCSWLNKESFQLQQAGQRYRVNQLPVTSSSHLRDVSRPRLQSDSTGGDAAAARNVRFDHQEANASLQDHCVSSYTHADDVICDSPPAVTNHR